ncbi:MAG: A24 family peptidase [Nanoarchaeota archaeon]
MELMILFILAFALIVIATYQDLRTTEISDWLTFSLIGFGLSYRAVYAFFTSSGEFFWFGLAGFALFSALGYLFYYAHVFAGGDVKLLMGLGAVIPALSYSELLFYGILMIVCIFLLGAIWSVVFTFIRIARKPGNFGSYFLKEMKKSKNILLLFAITGLLFFMGLGYFEFIVGLIFGVLIIISGILFVYVRAFEKHYLIVNKKPSELIEGDWLVGDIIVSGRTIKKSVHGLTEKEIAFLRKHNKGVIVKDGVPFTPGFLFGFLLFMLIYFEYISLAILGF